MTRSEKYYRGALDLVSLGALVIVLDPDHPFRKPKCLIHSAEANSMSRQSCDCRYVTGVGDSMVITDRRADRER